MGIIASDLHGNIDHAQAFLAYRREQVHVALGDLVDSRGQFDLATERKCLQMLIESESVLLWGNHDLAYLPEHPWSCFGSHGNFGDIFDEARDRILAAYSIDGWLCTHAGVSPELAQLIPAEAITSGVEAVASWLNQEFARELAELRPGIFTLPRHGYGPLFNVPVCRGGADGFGGIFWFDPKGEQAPPSAEVGPQIFGHSPVSQPERGETRSTGPKHEVTGKWINLNAKSGLWIYDTEQDEIINLHPW